MDRRRQRVVRLTSPEGRGDILHTQRDDPGRRQQVGARPPPRFGLIIMSKTDESGVRLTMMSKQVEAVLRSR